ncbi:nudC domain-containing protein 3 [Bombus vosnesenskii]|uniref:NudC domain-containing protein 3 n=3 Tax=Pyrobombus TaxID=144703 RepID=A0A6J3LNN9_9HYME|nr:nudC domain-containing protein 3 [Bombus impatiens]XP_033175072.1 nudC domain-containing protein 3 [Bombus impatiens]XP_033183801.1 nudC domain-containing protein 3 [Bombus vancouverensis nearcticus]XP_033183802.1 nudC domain-containing protein 3 [Bombus vancouverensis nearcticus]XP_033297712.1 nudC domain-containing protein 3 [Bombus bifarius]XP_033297713.1 nudC domain-containing protein 3 [Bombus bifarius]XP_033367102.1 nudC domain-containing protein 3 [Bombus vosnesenskii]XP_033367103.
MCSVHDQAFLQILQEERDITNFLDAFFGFLYRCTDFYVESGPDQKLGFPTGTIEKLVLHSFQKWKNIYKFSSGSDPPDTQDIIIQNNDKDQDETMTIEEDSLIPQVDHEVEIETCKESMNQLGHLIERDRSCDSYNGAVRENYTWSQTISDIDVLVKLPSCIRTAKDLRVQLDSKEIKIEARTSRVEQNQEIEECRYFIWSTIFKGELRFKIRKDESMWSIVPGQYISIHFEKASERWWEALIIGEPKIDLSKIDCSRNLDEMGSEEQMKVQELMWNHQQKLMGKPTSEQIKMERVLRKAWDAEGSPFEGSPYDPSLMNFN